MGVAKRPVIHTSDGEAIATTMANLRRFVLLRDGYCLLATLRYPGHECEGRWQRRAQRTNDSDYTLEHLTMVHSISEGRVDDDAHTVALCYATNIKPPSSDERAVMRDHVRFLYPVCPR